MRLVPRDDFANAAPLVGGSGTVVGANVDATWHDATWEPGERNHAPMISYALRAKNKGDEDKLAVGIAADIHVDRADETERSGRGNRQRLDVREHPDEAEVRRPQPLGHARERAAGPTTFCNGSAVALTSTAGVNYSWSPGGGMTP